MKDVLVHIEPVQAGSGDPSPDNVRPITGWTGAKVTRTGKNLLNPTLASGTSTGNGITWTLNNDGSVTVSGTATSKSYLWLYGSTSTPIPSWMYKLAGKTVTASTGNGHFTRAGYASIQVILYGSPTFVIREETATIPSDLSPYTGFAIVLFVNTGNTVDATVYPQFELGSTATDYEPYSGQTYDITFPSESGTVYGGTLDVTKGELVVDRAVLTYNTANMSNSEDYPGWKDAKVADIAGTGINATMPEIVTNVGIGVGVNTIVVPGAIFLPKQLHNNLTQSDWKALAIDIQIVLPIATPITYHLTPQEITSLLGENNVWADTGDSKVEYVIETTGSYIDKKIKDEKDYVTPEMFGAKGDGVTDDTQAIQSALSSGQNVLMNGNYLVAVSEDGKTTLSIDTNDIDVTINGTITLETNGFGSYRILLLNDVENVCIHGNGKIVGDKLTHTDTSGEWGHCLAIYGCKNVSIDGLEFQYGFGDGIYIKESDNNIPTNIELINVKCDNNRRNGLSVICGVKIRVYNSDFSNNSGIAPQAGIDIEPNDATEIIDVYIDGCILYDNGSIGLDCTNAFACNQFDVTVGLIKFVNTGLYISSTTPNFNFNASNIEHLLTRVFPESAMQTIIICDGNNMFVDRFVLNANSYTTGTTYFMHTTGNTAKPYIDNLVIFADNFGRLCGNSSVISLGIGTFVNKIKMVTSDYINYSDLTIDKVISDPVTYGTDSINMYTSKLIIPPDSTETGNIPLPYRNMLYDGYEIFVVNLSANVAKLYSYQSTHILPDGTTAPVCSLPAGKMGKLKYCKDNYSVFMEYIR